MKKGLNKIWYSTIVSLSIIAIQSSALASGFRIPELSTAGVATSNAIVANSEIAGAMAYNPAIMTYHPDNTLVLGITQLEYDLSVEIAGTTTDNIGEDSFTIPNLYYMKNIRDGVNFGIAINAPFGLETKWPKETFPGFAGPLDAYEYEKTKIQMVNINPNFSFEIDDYSSISLGFMYYDIQDVVFNTYAFKVNGSGTGNGWNIGYIIKNETLSFGISYKSEVQSNLTGTVDGSNIPVAQGGPSSVAPGDLSLTLPSILQAGFNLKINPELTIEFDYEHTTWNTFDVITINHSSTPTVAALFTNPIISTNNWQNSNTYRLSAIYDLSTKTQLRFGFSKDETPQTAKATFSPRISDNDRNLYSIGAAFDVDGWLIEVGYLLADVDTRVVTDNTRVAGTYNSEAQLFSVGVVKSF